MSASRSPDVNAHQPVNSTVLNLREPLTPRTQFVRSLASAAVLVALAGCEADSWMDPSRTGYFETTPTTMPILARLDVIDQAGIRGAHISSPTAEDLVPSELKYRLSPGDRVRIEIFELIAPGETEIIERTIDQTGNIPIKQLGDVVAAGLTIEEFKNEIESKAARIIQNPLVSVSLELGQGFQFSISGSVQSTGVFALTRPDFRLSEAIALAGGTLPTTQRVTVVRAAPLDDTLNPIYPEPQAGRENSGGSPKETGSNTAKPTVDIDDLINQLDAGSTTPTKPSDGTPPGTPPTAPTTDPTSAPAPAADLAPTTAPTAAPGAAFGMLGDGSSRESRCQSRLRRSTE